MVVNQGIVNQVTSDDRFNEPGTTLISCLFFLLLLLLLSPPFNHLMRQEREREREREREKERERTIAVLGMNISVEETERTVYQLLCLKLRMV